MCAASRRSIRSPRPSTSRSRRPSPSPKALTGTTTVELLLSLASEGPAACCTHGDVLFDVLGIVADAGVHLDGPQGAPVRRRSTLGPRGRGRTVRRGAFRRSSHHARAALGGESSPRAPRSSRSASSYGRSAAGHHRASAMRRPSMPRTRSRGRRPSRDPIPSGTWPRVVEGLRERAQVHAEGLVRPGVIAGKDLAGDVPARSGSCARIVVRGVGPGGALPRPRRRIREIVRVDRGKSSGSAERRCTVPELFG